MAERFLKSSCRSPTVMCSKVNKVREVSDRAIWSWVVIVRAASWNAVGGQAIQQWFS